MLSFCLLAPLALASCTTVSTEPAGPVPTEISTAIKDARAVAAKIGERIWPGYGRAHFGFLFVTAEHEVLICDPRLPDGFVRATRHQGLDCDVATGPKSWRNPSFLAAMPVFGPPSVIVMGSPETTGKSLPDWKLTVLHEHFHQWQSELPDYYQRVAALDLANGDETGMWMLNYPFPYDRADVVEAYAAASIALADAIERKDKASTQAYLKARRDFAAAISPAEWRYFEFQLWQEGVARWSEIAIGETSGREELVTAAKAKRASVIANLRNPSLAVEKRVSVYSFGAGEAMLLERAMPGWRKCYPALLSLGPLFEKACSAR